MNIEALRRFLGHTTAGENGCLLWTGASSRKGYGRVKVEQVMHMAHRWIDEFLRGPIPDHLQIHHVCEVKPCVNPAHLIRVTPRTNLMLSDTEARKNALKTQCKRGHPLQGENLYVDPRGKRECRECRRAATRRYRRRQQTTSTRRE